MSPTMTEGNIANWKVKEGKNIKIQPELLNHAHVSATGDSYVTGDVLLEIETDKAQMDVEAQDEGKVAKITQQAGAKGIKVGARIAILAETDDDLSTLFLPNEDPLPTQSSSKDPPKSTTSPPSSSESQPSAPTNLTTSATTHPQTYPLYPSVSALLHQHNLDLSTTSTIPATGPKGRLLKGDVLAHLGQIPSSYPSELSTRLSKLSHLNLSNITPAPPPSSQTTTTPPPPPPSQQRRTLTPLRNRDRPPHLPLPPPRPPKTRPRRPRHHPPPLNLPSARNRAREPEPTPSYQLHADCRRVIRRRARAAESNPETLEGGLYPADLYGVCGWR